MEAQERTENEHRSPWVDNNFSEPDALHRGDFLAGPSLAFQQSLSNFDFSSRTAADTRTAAGAKTAVDNGARGDANLPTVIFLKTQKDAGARDNQVEKTASELAKFDRQRR